MKKIDSLYSYIAIYFELLMELVISISFIKTIFSFRFSFMNPDLTLTTQQHFLHLQFFPITFYFSQKYSFIQISQL